MSRHRGVVTVAALLVLGVVCVPVLSGTARAARLVAMGTGATGGYYFVLGAAMAKVIKQYGGDLNVVPQSVQGSAQTIKLVSGGELALGLAVADALHYAHKGEREFDKAYPDYRLVLPIPYVAMAFVVLRDSPVQSLRDVKGRSVAANSKTTEQINVELLKEFGFGPDDYKRRVLNYTEMASALKDRTLDVMSQPAWPRSATILELASSRPIRFLDIDPVALKRFDDKHPYWISVTVPPGVYPGQDGEVRATGSFGYLIANKGVDAQVVYDVTKALLEHSEELGKIHPSGKDITLDLVKFYVAKGITPVAFHPGAVRYLREKQITVR